MTLKEIVEKEMREAGAACFDCPEILDRAISVAVRLVERWGHVAACDCHIRKEIVGCGVHPGRPCHDPRCAPVEDADGR